MKTIFCYLTVILIVGSNSLSAQDSLKRAKNLKIIPLPAIFYTPETRLGFGVLTSGVFNLGDKVDTRNSNVEVLAAYTLNDQIILRSKHIIFTREERYVFSGELSYFDFPILYYGVGNDTSKEFEEELGYQVVNFRERVLKQLMPHFFAGLQYRITSLYDLKFEPEFLVDEKPRLESDVGIYSGIGTSFIYDTRDRVLNASTGHYLEFSTLFHDDFIGSEFDFNRYTFDLRKFWTLNKKSVLAIQFFSEFNTGDVPFREMAQLGGDDIMRGYYDGRFRDKQQMAIQSEYRRQLNIVPWLGFTVFGSLGDVSDRFSSFDPTDFKYTLGGGLRFMVNKEDRLNIRIDYGIGKETAGFYFAFAEAF